jgi:2-C-methyl-D-erythritol 4-phosphate cytidylyltransferase
MGISGKSKVLLQSQPNNKSVLYFTLKALADSHSFAGIVVACRENDHESISNVLSEAAGDLPFKVVLGGETRSQSVKNAIAELPENTTHVAVHDGARPLVSISDIQEVVKVGVQTNAAILATPCRYTIKHADQDIVSKTIDRTDLWESQTPQVFSIDFIKRAYQAETYHNATDDASLVEKLGVSIRIVNGSALNIKITTPEDLVLLEKLLPS